MKNIGLRALRISSRIYIRKILDGGTAFYMQISLNIVNVAENKITIPY